ncbi:hypothetical protein PHLCEN_2v12551, partial [Hermanssonia centrifuga]
IRDVFGIFNRTLHAYSAPRYTTIETTTAERQLSLDNVVNVTTTAERQPVPDNAANVDYNIGFNFNFNFNFNFPFDVVKLSRGRFGRNVWRKRLKENLPIRLLVVGWRCDKRGRNRPEIHRVPLNLLQAKQSESPEATLTVRLFNKE